MTDLLFPQYVRYPELFTEALQHGDVSAVGHAFSVPRSQHLDIIHDLMICNFAPFLEDIPLAAKIADYRMQFMRIRSSVIVALAAQYGEGLPGDNLRAAMPEYSDDEIVQCAIGTNDTKLLQFLLRSLDLDAESAIGAVTRYALRLSMRTKVLPRTLSKMNCFLMYGPSLDGAVEYLVNHGHLVALMMLSNSTTSVKSIVRWRAVGVEPIARAMKLRQANGLTPCPSHLIPYLANAANGKGNITPAKWQALKDLICDTIDVDGLSAELDLPLHHRQLAISNALAVALAAEAKDETPETKAAKLKVECDAITDAAEQVIADLSVDDEANRQRWAVELESSEVTLTGASELLALSIANGTNIELRRRQVHYARNRVRTHTLNVDRAADAAVGRTAIASAIRAEAAAAVEALVNKGKKDGKKGGGKKGGKKNKKGKKGKKGGSDDENNDESGDDDESNGGGKNGGKKGKRPSNIDS